MFKTLNIFKKIVFVLIIFLCLDNIVCTSDGMEDLSRHMKNFDMGDVSFIAKVEVPPGALRALYYDLKPEYTNCQVLMEYFTLYHFGYKNIGSPLRTAIDLIGPNDSIIWQAAFRINQ